MKTTATTAGDFVALGARRYPGSVALRDRDGNERTYAELDARTNRLANALSGLGLGRGDRVAAWMTDCFEYVEVYIAAAKGGFVVCPINARLAAAEAEHQLADSGSRVLIWTAELDERVAHLDLGDLGALRVGADGDAPVHDYELALRDASATAPADAPAPGDPYFLGYTSGTTGRPRGAVLTHGSVLSIARQNACSYRLSAYPEWGMTGSMSFVSTVPAHVLCCLGLGGTVNFMGHWDADDLLDAISRRHLSFAYVASPLLGDVTDVFARHRDALGSLDAILHSASQARPEQLEALFDVIGDRLVEGWGMTEHSGGLATATSRRDYRDTSPGHPVFRSVGRAALDVDLRLVDEGGAPLPHDGETVGEIAIASPAVMSGYWRQPEASAAVLRDGWYHSGDLGTISPEGLVFISARRTDLIVSGGANVYPAEVERCIGELAGVDEVAVVGAPHPRWDEAVTAVIVARPGANLSEQAVIDHCRRHMASYKKPSRVFFVPDLPRTTSLKIARGELRAWVAQEVARARD